LLQQVVSPERDGDWMPYLEIEEHASDEVMSLTGAKIHV
jgi:hypothetical protein